MKMGISLVYMQLCGKNHSYSAKNMQEMSQNENPKTYTQNLWSLAALKLNKSGRI